ncbi:MAG: hypothetical protein IPJ65_16490 [Archangiaceae bacterium]|nr:hypothetical protein [Archangiaceae bacterium]
MNGRTAISAVVVMMVTGSGCGDTQPCSTCPPIEGTWFLQYLAPEQACDGGTPAAPPSTLAFTREGSVLHTAVDGVALGGTLYDTYQFSLNGQMLGSSGLISLRGTYKPASGPDAGDEGLVGGLLTRESSACLETRRFTGARY